MKESFKFDFAGQAGVLPSFPRIFTSESLATITSAGWIDDKLTERGLEPTDIVEVMYGYNENTNVGTYGQFTVSISTDGVTTLVEYVSPASVTLPVANNDVAIFDGTTGKIKSLGSQIIADVTAVWGGGATSFAFTATGLTADTAVSATIRTQTNSASIVSAVPSADTLTVTFSADPGAATTVQYVAIVQS